MPTSPSSPLSPWSSALLQIPSPPLPLILSPLLVLPPLPQISLTPLLVSSLVPVLSPSPPASPIRPLGYRAAMIKLELRLYEVGESSSAAALDDRGGSTAGSDYRATGSRPQEAGGDYRDAGGRLQEAQAVHKGTEVAEETLGSDGRVRETAGTRQRSYTARCTRGGW
ncbi:hypothetical protein Tco_0002214 [Tanacetum coccineum]